MTLEEEFNTAVIRTKQLKQRPTNQTLLLLYALFKQATVGDISEVQAPDHDFKAIAKFNAWKAQKGKSKEACMQDYINLVQSLD